MLARTRSRNLARARDLQVPRHSLIGDAARPVGSSGRQASGAPATLESHSPITLSTTSDEMASSPRDAPAMRQSEARRSSSARAAVRVKMKPGHGTPAEDCFAAAGRGQFGAQIRFRFRTHERSQANGERPRLVKPALFVALPPRTSKIVSRPPVEAPIWPSRRRSSSARW